jgi:aldose 1-epimerase
MAGRIDPSGGLRPELGKIDAKESGRIDPSGGLRPELGKIDAKESGRIDPSGGLRPELGKIDAKESECIDPSGGIQPELRKIDADEKSAAERNVRHMSRSVFGRLPDGATVERLTLAAHGLRLSVLTLGAIIQDFAVETPEGGRRLVLGFDMLDPYLGDARYFGCVAGRSANRIRGGELRLDGVTHQLELNENGKTHLHGGMSGFSGKIWRIAAETPESVTLALHSPDGEGGYPGAVDVSCTYRLAPERRLVIELEAKTDRKTVVNLATHSYFNLDGGADILAHRLRIPADHYTPVDADLIPTGEIAAVAGSPFDFREPRAIADGGRDHNFCIAREPSAEPRLAARLEGALSGLALEVWSTEPGLQFYDGGYLDLSAAPNGASAGGPHAGLCLEPQRYPDAPHHRHFPSTVLAAGETYRQVTEYRVFRR